MKLKNCLHHPVEYLPLPDQKFKLKIFKVINDEPFTSFEFDRSLTRRSVLKEDAEINFATTKPEVPIKRVLHGNLLKIHA